MPLRTIGLGPQRRRRRARSDQVRETPGESWAMAATEASVISSFVTSARRGSYTITMEDEEVEKCVSDVVQSRTLEA